METGCMAQTNGVHVSYRTCNNKKKPRSTNVGREKYFYISPEANVKFFYYRARNGLSKNLCAITNGPKIKIITASYFLGIAFYKKNCCKFNAKHEYRLLIQCFPFIDALMPNLIGFPNMPLVLKPVYA